MVCSKLLWNFFRKIEICNKILKHVTCFYNAKHVTCFHFLSKLATHDSSFCRSWPKQQLLWWYIASCFEIFLEKSKYLKGVTFTTYSRWKIFLLKKHVSRGNFMREIDFAHSRSVKMLPWPWFREWGGCIEAKIKHFRIFMRKPSILRFF